MLADALRFRRNADFWRVADEWGEAECRAHAGCLDLQGSTLLHLAVEHCDSTRGDIMIVETILEWGAPLEALSTYGGTALACAIEYKQWPVVRLLVARGADRTVGVHRGRFGGRWRVVGPMPAFTTERVFSAASWLYCCVLLKLHMLIKPRMAVRVAGSRVWLRSDGRLWLCTSCHELWTGGRV